MKQEFIKQALAQPICRVSISEEDRARNRRLVINHLELRQSVTEAIKGAARRNDGKHAMEWICDVGKSQTALYDAILPQSLLEDLANKYTTTYADLALGKPEKQDPPPLVASIGVIATGEVVYTSWSVHYGLWTSGPDALGPASGVGMLRAAAVVVHREEGFIPLAGMLTSLSYVGSGEHEPKPPADYPKHQKPETLVSMPVRFDGVNGLHKRFIYRDENTVWTKTDDTVYASWGHAVPDDDDDIVSFGPGAGLVGSSTIHMALYLASLSILRGHAADLDVVMDDAAVIPQLLRVLTPSGCADLDAVSDCVVNYKKNRRSVDPSAN